MTLNLTQGHQVKEISLTTTITTACRIGTPAPQKGGYKAVQFFIYFFLANVLGMFYMLNTPHVTH